jgi:extradiol dioxygenase family protein
MRPFHLAFPVDDLAAAEEFYVGVLGCGKGRASDRWIDFDLFGHQVVAHLVESAGVVERNEVDGDAVPAFHFGAVLSMGEWAGLVDRLRSAGVEFLIEPKTRFVGQPGEQSTFFVRDPAGNALEFKAFADPGQLFATGTSGIA